MGRPAKFGDANARVAAHRQRSEAAGDALVQVRLSAEARAALDQLTSASGETKSAVIDRLLKAAANAL